LPESPALTDVVVSPFASWIAGPWYGGIVMAVEILLSALKGMGIGWGQLVVHGSPQDLLSTEWF
jgi:hypothetical protein